MNVADPEPWGRVYEFGGEIHQPAGGRSVTGCGVDVGMLGRVPAEYTTGRPCRRPGCYGPDDLMSLSEALSVPPDVAAAVDRAVGLAAQWSRR